MSKITVCARFRPQNARERQEHGDSFCIERIDDDAFLLKDEKEGEFKFNFDNVFYKDSEQADVYAFMARQIVQDVLTGINGIIISYGQTGAGKTYSMEGMGVLDTVKSSEGILARIVADLFAHVSSSKEYADYSVKLSMVEIYMEKVRDHLDLSKDNIQMKETKSQEIILHQITDILLTDVEAALRILSTGITNRAMGETQMNLSSSRSHCIYLFSVLHELTGDKRASHIKVSPPVNFTRHRQMKTIGVLSPIKDESSEYVSAEVVEKPDVGRVKLLEEEVSAPNSIDSEEVLSPFSMQLQEAMKDLASTLEQVT